MAQDWLLEFLFGAGKLFLHPVLYILVCLAAFLGVSRVKRERKNFHVRVENAYFELRQLLPAGLLIGLVLSVIIIAIGIVIPLEAVFFTAGVTVLLLLTTRIRLLSPAYTVGIATLVLLLSPWQKWPLPYFNEIQLDKQAYPALAALLALLLIGEGILILWNGSKGTSPKLINGKRGQRVGVHEVKRVWLLPVFLLIPGDVLHLPFSWWPTLSVGGDTYSLLLVPFAVGMYQQVKSMLPKEAIRYQGKRVVILGVMTTLLAAATFFIHLQLLELSRLR